MGIKGKGWGEKGWCGVGGDGRNMKRDAKERGRGRARTGSVREWREILNDGVYVSVLFMMDS